jgi:phosphoribosylformylglycinamidine cyclo-ligase
VSAPDAPAGAPSAVGGRPGLDYGAAGVDLRAAADGKERLRRIVNATRTAGVAGAFGGFGGLFRAPAGPRAAARVERRRRRHEGQGRGRRGAPHHRGARPREPLCQRRARAGAAPLFFLDYVAFGKLDPAAVEDVVAGVARGCLENGCALVGGETAEMPGVYTPPDFDLAGFIVGWVEEDAVLGAHRVREDDVIVGLASSGLHTNGYSLARRIVAERLGLGPHDAFPEHPGSTAADVLLAVHRSYLAALRPVLDRVHALAHITGGGLPGNLDRSLPPGLDAVLDAASWEVPPLFRVLEAAGGVSRDEMLRTFNMGVGMCVVADAADVDAVLGAAGSAGVPAWVLGHVAPGDRRVRLR